MSEFWGDDPYKALRPGELAHSQPIEDSWFLRGETPPDEPQKLVPKYWLRRVGVVAAGFAVAGGVAAGIATTSENKPKHGVTAAAAEHSEPGHSSGNFRVDTDFRHALAVDTCATKVTFPEVTDIYNTLFGPTDLEKLDITGLSSEVTKSVDAMRNLREQLGFVPLPKNFSELYADAHNGRLLPIGEYQRALTDYTAKFGIKDYYTWSVSYKAMLNPHDFAISAKPMSNRALSESKISREEIVSIMDDLSNMPPRLVEKDAGRKRIAIGHYTLGKGIIGDSQIGENMTFINAAALAHANVAELDDNTPIITSVYSHETMHALVWNTCYPTRHKTAQIKDKAYTSFNDGFQYGPLAEGEFIEPNAIATDKGFTPLDATIPGKVVVADSYGASLEIEDAPTLIGQNVLYTPNTVNLFDPIGDKKIIYEKIAYWMARLEHEDPQAAAYYVQAIKAGKLLQAIYDGMEKVPSKILTNPDLVVKYQQPYMNMAASLRQALGYH